MTQLAGTRMVLHQLAWPRGPMQDCLQHGLQLLAALKVKQLPQQCITTSASACTWAMHRIPWAIIPERTIVESRGE